MKKYIIVFLWLLSLLPLQMHGSVQGNMIPNPENVKSFIDTQWTSWWDQLNSVLLYVTNVIFWILWVLAVWIFIYLWFRLISAQWNQEEFKKALLGFVYAVIWLTVIPLAWAAVKLVTGLRF